DLVKSRVDVIVVSDTPSTLAAKRATTTIPIIMVLIADPVGSGLVASLAHPESNVTGLTIMVPDLTAKRLEVLKETLPFASRVAVFWNPDSPSHPKVTEELKAAAPALSMQLSFMSVRAPDQFGAAFLAVKRVRAQVLYVVDDAFFAASVQTILGSAAQARLPV